MENKLRTFYNEKLHEASNRKYVKRETRLKTPFRFSRSVRLEAAPIDSVADTPAGPLARRRLAIVSDRRTMGPPAHYRRVPITVGRSHTMDNPPRSGRLKPVRNGRLERTSTESHSISSRNPAIAVSNRTRSGATSFHSESNLSLALS